MRGSSSPPATPGQREVRPVIVTPTYNHAAALPDTLARIDALALPVIVVDDGSTDHTAEVLDRWSALPRSHATYVIAHPVNRGKAAALRSGFSAARKLGYTHAVTIDSDGQLEPEEIPHLLDAARRHPCALVLGRRSLNTPGLPKRNVVGWFASALGIWVETGAVVCDSQCGLRVYPLALFDVVRCRAGRFGFEAEIITRALWAGAPVVEVPVSCHYPAQTDRVSHLRPVVDGIKGFFMHWGLAVRRLIPWPCRKLTEVVSADCTVDAAGSPKGRDAVALNRASRRHWLDPRAFIRQIRSSRLEQLFAASSFAHGVFWACLPLGWLTLAVTVYGSRRLHHHLWAALIGAAALMTPPMSRAVSQAGISIGHLILHFRLPDRWPPLPESDGVLSGFAAYPWSWLLGGLVLGTLLHWVTIFVIYAALRAVPSGRGE